MRSICAAALLIATFTWALPPIVHPDAIESVTYSSSGEWVAVQSRGFLSVAHESNGLVYRRSIQWETDRPYCRENIVCFEPKDGNEDEMYLHLPTMREWRRSEWPLFNDDGTKLLSVAAEPAGCRVSYKNLTDGTHSSSTFPADDCALDNALFSADGKLVLLNFLNSGAHLFRLDRALIAQRPPNWDFSYAQFWDNDTVIGSSGEAGGVNIISLQSVRWNTKVPLHTVTDGLWYPPFSVLTGGKVLIGDHTPAGKALITVLNQRTNVSFSMALTGYDLEALLKTSDFLVRKDGVVWEFATGDLHRFPVPANLTFDWAIANTEGTRILFSAGETLSEQTLYLYDRPQRRILASHPFQAAKRSFLGETALFRSGEQLHQLDIQSGQILRSVPLANDFRNVLFNASADARFWTYSVLTVMDGAEGFLTLIDQVAGTKTRIDDADWAVFRPDGKQMAVRVFNGNQVRFIDLP
jgi:hypothetical protein